MASSLQQAVSSIQLNDYMSLAILTVVGYDYILTLADEIEYIWSKPWTWVSTLFVLARYFGLGNTISATFLGSSFLPRPAKIHFKGETIFFFYSWGFWIFMCAAELVMILRLWALYDRSRFILGTLLAFYAIQVISFLAVNIIIIVRRNRDPIVGTAHVLHFSFCIWEPYAPILGEVPDTIRMALGALMCLLTIIRFIKESLQMYRATKRFQVSQYMKHLVGEGLIYFITILGVSLMNLLGDAGVGGANGWQIVVTSGLQEISPFTLIPRFILHLRELYAHDLQGRQGSYIDTAFGLGSVSRHDVPPNVIVFADAGQNGDGWGDEVELEEGTWRTSPGEHA